MLFNADEKEKQMPNTEKISSLMNGDDGVVINVPFSWHYDLKNVRCAHLRSP